MLRLDVALGRLFSLSPSIPTGSALDYFSKAVGRIGDYSTRWALNVFSEAVDGEMVQSGVQPAALRKPRLAWLTPTPSQPTA